MEIKLCNSLPNKSCWKMNTYFIDQVEEHQIGICPLVLYLFLKMGEVLNIIIDQIMNIRELQGSYVT
jgi:hypothetical protein